MLFDHLIRPRQHIRWYRETDLFRGFQVDHEFELGRLLDWNLGRLRALKNLVDIHAARL